MTEKPFRLWAYHHEWIETGANFAVLPEHRSPREMRLLRRHAKKAARRARRKVIAQRTRAEVFK